MTIAEVMNIVNLIERGQGYTVTDAELETAADRLLRSPAFYDNYYASLVVIEDEQALRRSLV